MSTKFLPHPSPPESSEDFQFEEQQARLLATLRRAGGAPVSYAELRDAGVEFPASVVSELELAGVEFHHCYVGEARGVVGVRLEPAGDPARFSAPTDLGAPAEQQPPAEPLYTTARERRRIITALLVAREAALVRIANAARLARHATRGAIQSLPAASRPVADRLDGGSVAERLKRRSPDRSSGRPLADRLDGRLRGLLGLGVIVLAMVVFAAIGLTAGGGRGHRATAHRHQARVLSTAGSTARPAVHHPRPSQASTTGAGETTSSCSACQSVGEVRSLRSEPRSPRRARAVPPAPHHARGAPQARTRPAPSRPRTPVQHPTGGHHDGSTTTPSDQASTTGGTGAGQP